MFNMRFILLVSLMFSAAGICFGDIDYNVNISNIHLSKPGRSKASILYKNGMAVMKFSLKPGKHTWGYICIKIPEGELENKFKGIKFTYRASIPEGVNLKTIVDEDGIAYNSIVPCYEPGEWLTVTIPFSEFKLSSWNRKRDQNKKLDSNMIRTVLFGFEGLIKSSEELTGKIELKSISFTDYLTQNQN